MPKIEKPSKNTYRFGIGEWYGKSFVHLKPKERKQFADIQALPKRDRPILPCPFRSVPDRMVKCSKAGGVCSIRLYQKDGSTGTVSVANGEVGNVRVTCPHRFKEDLTIYKIVGETVLHDASPSVLGEVGFLETEMSEAGDEDGKADDVGMIDNILISSEARSLSWCALEIQAVYFSGDSMEREFSMLRTNMEKLPFPAGDRHPDYRSSGPKRLMPQLQIKVPSLRRWGKKMAVVVDRNFFKSLGRMDSVRDLSNADVAWIVVRFREFDSKVVIEQDFVQNTTLERAVEGLTGGVPVSLEVFEQRIRLKLELEKKKQRKSRNIVSEDA